MCSSKLFHFTTIYLVVPEQKKVLTTNNWLFKKATNTIDQCACSSVMHIITYPVEYEQLNNLVSTL